MKRLVWLATTAIGLAACSTSPGPMVEAGYPTGSLAVAAIERSDWAAAERLLTQEGQVGRDNPARLINLGRVYAETGRISEAVSIWQRALEAPIHTEVQTADGLTSRTDDVARKAIAQYRSRVQTASAIISN